MASRPGGRSSSSSDEEEKQRLRAAVIHDAANWSKSIYGDEKKKQKPSLRPVPDNGMDQNGGLNTTPEFKQFVAKKLSQLLDSTIKEANLVKNSFANHTADDSGIKLLSTSKILLKQVNDGITQPNRQSRRLICSSSSSDSSEDEKFRLIAVSGRFIIEQSQVLDYTAVHEQQVSSSLSFQNTTATGSGEQGCTKTERHVCKCREESEKNGAELSNTYGHPEKIKKKRRKHSVQPSEEKRPKLNDLLKGNNKNEESGSPNRALSQTNLDKVSHLNVSNLTNEVCNQDGSVFSKRKRKHKQKTQNEES